MPSTILVTGDVTSDFNIYLPTDSDNPPPGAPPTILRSTLGGAGIVERILSHTAIASAPDGGVRLVYASATTDSPVAALWHPVEIGRVAKDPKLRVWRTQRSLSLGQLSGGVALPRPPQPKSSVEPHEPKDYASQILVVEDNGAGFRFSPPEAFTTFLKSTTAELPALVVLKTCAPIGHGALWWSLTNRPELADRLVVVLSVNDLRKSDIRISHGISWERTAMDLVRELKHSPALACLHRARHVVVTVHGEGALWMERTGEGHAAFQLFFDPAHVEGEWSANAARNGEAYGYHSTFVAALAADFSITSDPSHAIAQGIDRGLKAMRLLKAIGHGAVDSKPAPTTEASPDFPARILAGIVEGKSLADALPGLVLENFGTFARVAAPEGQCNGSWRILESANVASNQPAARLPLYGKAQRVALLGRKQLNDVPCAIFGKIFTADRDEIESLRNLKRLIEGYQQDKKETKPLSIAVFGPPGAGKSFGIKQIAEKVVEDRDRAFLEFNLSQFSNPADLIGAFHQVRDKVLEGKLPIVFWDEFDAKNYDWLQYLLAPMQDGKFQEGQLTHPIGRCIFVFAGATSYTCDNFGPPKPAPTDTSEKKKAYADFVLKKGPDFISRLHGSLNVLGPNPRQKFNGAEWEDDPTDICFPVRRAILLRSMLGLMDEKSATKRLEIDPGLLGALLEVGHYRYGSRSFEKIVMAIKSGAAAGYRRSNLPTDEVLAMNLPELDDFKALLDEAGAILPHVDILAAAIHARWLTIAEFKNGFRVKYEELSDEAKADNIAAALRLPNILGLAGLRLVPLDDGAEAVADVDVRLKAQLEVLAEEEHIGWMNVRLRNGWKPVARTEDPAEKALQRAKLQHDCLIAYDKLLEKEQEKDRGAILWYPKLAALAGFKIVARQPARKT